MGAVLNPKRQMQLHSLWSLIQTTDEPIQKELFVMLGRKYSHNTATPETEAPPFQQLKGILKGKGSAETDREMLNEYLQEKYSV
jgi:hypothetical protein